MNLEAFWYECVSGARCLRQQTCAKLAHARRMLFQLFAQPIQVVPVAQTARQESIGGNRWI